MIQSLFSFAALYAAAPAGLEGHWINPAQSVMMAIEPCGETYCGTVVWASEAAKADARRGTDQLLGARLLWNVKPGGDGGWEGRLFVPDANRRAHAKLKLLDESQLKVSGCAVGRSLCKSQVWTRTDQLDLAQ